MSLASKSCIACRKGTLALTADEVRRLITELNGWELTQHGKAITKSWKFKNFKQAWEFVERVGGIAEEANHHPDIAFGWGYATLTLTTHAIGSLHENDFIVAARVDAII